MRKKKTPRDPSRTTKIEYALLALLVLLVLFAGATLCQAVIA